MIWLLVLVGLLFVSGVRDHWRMLSANLRAREARRALLFADKQLEESQEALQAARQTIAKWYDLCQLENALSDLLEEEIRKLDAGEMVLLTEIGTDALNLARADQVIEAWKSYALGYEVLCEAAADNEAAGIENAQAVIVAARESLRLLNEYDA